jgi:hypothetical protein
MFEGDGVMTSQRSTGAFVAGSVIGGIVAAAAVLWKTPKSGAELRGSLSGERHGAITYRAGEVQAVAEERRFSNPVLSFVEKAAAPIVGVELGKLAKDDPDVMATAPVRTSAADAKPPTSVTQLLPGAPVAGTAAAETSGYHERDATFAAQSQSEEITHDPVEGSTAHAATADELTSPTSGYVEQLQEGPDEATGPIEFLDLPSRDASR